MATFDDVVGLDVIWFGQPFVQVAGDPADVVCYAEPFAQLFTNSAPAVVFNATRMFLMF